jgi:hypothetical protein
MRLWRGHWIKQPKPWAPAWLVNALGVDYFGHVVVVIFSIPGGSEEAVLVQIGRLTQLRELLLDLSGSQVTDVGLVHLKGLTNLNLSYARNTRVTDGGVKNLQRTLPNLKMCR